MKRLKLFLLRGSLADLAVGVSIGAAFGTLVLAIVDDFIAPLLALALGKSDFGALAFSFGGSKFGYGDFITKLIAFIIIGAAVYFLIIVPFTKLVDRFEPVAMELGPVRDCPRCRSTVHHLADVCAFCGRDIDPEPDTNSEPDPAAAATAGRRPRWGNRARRTDAA